MNQTINKITNWCFILLVALIPLFFLPITTNFYAFNKNFLLAGLTAIMTLLWGIKALINQEIKTKKTPFDFLVFFLALVFILTTYFASPNKTEAIFAPGATGTIIALTILYFLITNFNFKAQSIINSIIASASLLALIAIYQSIGLGESLALGDQWAFLKTKIWTPTGSPLVLTTYLTIAFSLALPLAFKIKEGLNKIIFFLASALIVVGLIITVSQLLPGKEAALMLLPYPTTWAVAIETFKQSPLWGVGPNNFISAFNRFRPVTFNQSGFWDARFSVGSNYPLHLLTVSGVFGLTTFLLITLKVIKNIKTSTKKNLGFSLGLALLLLFLLPANFLLLFLIFVLLALWAPRAEQSVLKIPGKLAYIPLIGAIILTGTVFYFGGRAYAGEIYFKQSLDALAQNRGTDTYNLQIKAIGLNPRQTNFRIVYSQTNFALANALAANPPSGELTDQDRANISQLIQQSINEARAATVLNPTDARNWENLAQIYRNLVNFAEEADQWSIAAYQQAVLTDPTSPRIRVNLGGLLFALGNYEAAISHFQNAINLKPDYPNAYYNLSAAYRENNQIVNAVAAMEIAVNLVDINSADYQKARAELDDLRAKLPPEEKPVQAGEPETLREPEPLPSPAITPPIELPEELAPEITPESTLSPTPAL